MSVEIFVARHGQNVDNVDGILNGHRDLPLTELGRQQAVDLGESIKATDIHIDQVYSSPLSRALETAWIINKVLSLKDDPVIIPELIERDFGRWTGKPIKDAVEAAGSSVIQTDTVTYILDFEDGETFPQVVERAHLALTHVRRLQSEGTALLVCHGDIGKMVYAAATGKPWEEALTNFHFGNGDLIDVNANDEAHRVKLAQHNL